MKKTLLTLGALLGVSAGAFAQGALTIGNAQQPDFAGFNTVSSSPSDPTLSDFVTGTITLEIFSIGSSGNASIVSQINSDAASASTEQAAVSLLQANFTQQAYGTSLTSESMSQTFSVSEGDFTSAPLENIGSSSTITSGSSVYYAILASYNGMEGCLVLDATPGYGAGGGQFPTPAMYSIWPDQNVLLAPVPEPTTLALAGLGGLSMLFLRRRKA